MRKTTCKELGGVCSAVITGDTPEKMAQNAKDHIMDMLSDGDSEHRIVVNNILSMPKTAQMNRYNELVANFNKLEELHS